MYTYVCVNVLFASHSVYCLLMVNISTLCICIIWGTHISEVQTQTL